MRRSAAIGILFCALVIASVAAAGGSGWSIQQSPALENGGRLNGVSCTSASACTAVGTAFENETLAERWNGAKWSIQRTPTSKDGGTFTAVSCTSASACTAVGYGGKLGNKTLAERWNGAKWSIQPTPNPKGGGFLNGVSCRSAWRCTAAGSSGRLEVGDEPLVERWNGAKWSIQPTPDVRGQLNAVSCTSRRACTVVGLRYPGALLAERWNGAKWSIQPTPNPPKGVAELFGVSCTSAGICTGVGNDQFGKTHSATLAERWSRGKWSIQPTPNPAGSGELRVSYLTGVSCRSASACTAVGSSGSGTTLAERWDGGKWSIQPTPTPKDGGYLLQVSCKSARDCTAVGARQTQLGLTQTLVERRGR